MLAVIALLLQEDIQGLHDLYMTAYTRIVQHDWQVEDFARTETLKATVEYYQADVASGRRSKAAAYELASARARHTGQPLRKGDRLTYHITGTAPHLQNVDNYH